YPRREPHRRGKPGGSLTGRLAEEWVLCCFAHAASPSIRYKRTNPSCARSIRFAWRKRRNRQGVRRFCRRPGAPTPLSSRATGLQSIGETGEAGEPRQGVRSLTHLPSAAAYPRGLIGSIDHTMAQAYYTLEESAQILQLSADALKQMARKGQIRSFQD